MINKQILFLVLFINSLGISFSQNLIPDPSFENYSKKKRFAIETKHFKYWETPNNSSPDIFCPYNKSPSFQYNNKFWSGPHFPKTGETYFGIELFGYKDAEYREYINTPLRENLLRGHIYCFSMYISLAKICKSACDGIDIYVSSEKIESDKRNLFDYKIKPTLTKLGGITTETDNWVLVCSSFIAKGGEKYLYIGNFKDDKNTTLKIVKKRKMDYESDVNYQYSYYYLDDVSLVEISNEGNCNCSNKEELLSFADTAKSIDNSKIPLIPAGVSFVIPNLYFATNEWEILPKSFNNLDSLYSVLFENSNINILITGHTDDVGKEDWNLKLSENRAKAVADYLIKKGISAERIAFEGKGSTYPIASNETEKGREMNRRVEIMIRKK